MSSLDWAMDFPGSIMICDLEGTILEMNAKAARNYQKDGGMELVGKNLLECHPEPSRTKLKRLLETGDSNIHTVEKKGKKKLVYQVPWYQDGLRRGMVELLLEIPVDLPNFMRE